MDYNQKLYVVSRRDLRPGAQAVQAMHAIREFVHKFPEQDKQWYQQSNHLCFLSVENELELVALMHQANAKGIHWAAFQEPDFEMEYTAVCLEPTYSSKELCFGMPTALSEYAAGPRRQ
ncbi:MAG: peptidyl-tRNA hydrolase [Candidatus Paceibacterota bacterium]|jgi:hypothetical protein